MKYKYLIAGFIAGLALIAGTAYALPAIDRTTTIQPFADNTYNIGADGTEYAYGFLEELKLTGNASTTGTYFTGIGLDGIGAVDLDYGSGDITDHTFLTDGTGNTEIVLPIDSIGTGEILDATILEADIDADEAPTDNDILSFDTTGSNFSWQTPAELSLFELSGGTLTGAATGTFWYISSDLTVVGNTTLSGLTNCDTIDTDANGLLSCGTDDTGGGGSAAWEFDATNNGMTPTSTASGIYLQGSVTTTANIYVTGSVQITTSTILFNEDLSGSCDGATDAMTTANPFSTSSLQVYWNNRRLDYNDGDYSITLAAAGTFSLSLPDSYSCAATDSLFVDYVKNQF